MKLSSAYLASKISEKYKILQEINISGEDGHNRPKWNGKGAKGSFALFSGYQAFGSLDTDASCIIVQDGIDEMELFSLIQDVYDEAEEWYEKVHRILLGDRNLTELLKVSSDFLGNPLFVMGQDFSLVAKADCTGLSEQFNLYEGNSIKTEFMNMMIQYKGFEQGTQGPISYPAFLDGCRSLGIGLSVGERYTHRLVMTKTGNQSDAVYWHLFTELAKYTEYILANSPSLLERNGMEDIFLKLLSDKTADYMQISRRFTQLGWSEKHEYLCLVLQILYQESNAMTSQAICRYIRKQFPDSCSFEYETDVVVYFNLTKAGMESDEIEQKMACFIRDSYLNAGYSRVIQGHMSLRRQYVQARIAIETGSRVKPYGWIYRFNQVVLPYIMEQSVKKLPGNMICHEGILELKKVDDEHHTEYIQTLKTYLDTNLSATKAANELFIHRSTFLYRLDKIREILQTNIEEPDEIFYLNYSLRLLEYEREQS